MHSNYDKRWMGVSTIQVKQMNEYQFTLTFSLPSEKEDPAEYLDALYEADCDDAIVGTGASGSIALEFIREGKTANSVINSAIKNVKAAIPKAELIEAKPDLVGLTDVAEMLDCSRQNIRKYMQTYHAFPHPAYSGKSSLWHLWEVAKFEKPGIPETVAEIGRTTFKLNQDIKQHRFAKSI